MRELEKTAVRRRRVVVGPRKMLSLRQWSKRKSWMSKRSRRMKFRRGIYVPAC
jgi:hypothetical protein